MKRGKCLNYVCFGSNVVYFSELVLKKINLEIISGESVPEIEAILYIEKIIAIKSESIP